MGHALLLAKLPVDQQEQALSWGKIRRMPRLSKDASGTWFQCERDFRIVEGTGGPKLLTNHNEMARRFNLQRFKPAGHLACCVMIFKIILPKGRIQNVDPALYA